MGVLFYQSTHVGSMDDDSMTWLKLNLGHLPLASGVLMMHPGSILTMAN